MTSPDLIAAIMADGDLTFRLALRGGAREVAEMIARGRGVAMVRAEVLEEAAEVCDQAATRLLTGGGSRINQVDKHTAYVLRGNATAIRALADAAGEGGE